MSNSTELGDAFRDQIAGLLRIAGHKVTTEVLADHKKLDIRFETTGFGKPRRYVVEAKNWQDPPDKSDIETIVASHLSLLQEGKVDELIIISLHPLKSAAAKAYIERTRNVAYQTFFEFQEDIMGFGSHLHHLVSEHARDGLESYFIDSQARRRKQDLGESLESLVSTWVASDDFNPIAIISGYGMGKTSFARHIAYKFASKVLSNEPSRIPILISLGAIAREQSLEGLLGATLAGGGVFVRNYNFDLFIHLNDLGRFVVILDGFDEMKHMMTYSEFIANFDSLNRLVRGRAKVILLGRPSAFLSEDERQYVFRGLRRLDASYTKSPTAPVYAELTLVPFSPTQAQIFIAKYLEHYMHRDDISAKPSNDFIKKRQREIQDAGYGDLVSRPVHAKMLAEIATDPEISISGLTRYSLYEYFITHLIRRELQKPGRGKMLNEKDYRRFAGTLAWWLWTTTSAKGLGCRIEDLPDTLFVDYQSRLREDTSGVRRHMVSASFLEEKAPGVFYIPHRSFEEFLVAEYVSSAISTPAFPRDYEKFITSEIMAFMVDRSDWPRLAAQVRDALVSYHGTVSHSFLEALSTQVRSLGISGLSLSSAMNPWFIFILFAGMSTRSEADPEALSQEIQRLAESQAGDIISLLVVLMALVIYIPPTRLGGTSAFLRAFVGILMLKLDLSHFRWNTKLRRMTVSTTDERAVLLEIMIEGIERDDLGGPSLTLRFDPRGIVRKISSKLSPYYGISDYDDISKNSIVVKVPFHEVFGWLNDNDQSAYLTILRFYRETPSVMWAIEETESLVPLDARKPRSSRRRRDSKDG